MKLDNFGLVKLRTIVLFLFDYSTIKLALAFIPEQFYANIFQMFAIFVCLQWPIQLL